MESTRPKDLSLPALALLVLSSSAFGMAVLWFLSPVPPPAVPPAPTVVRGENISAHLLPNGFEVIVLEQPDTPIAASVLAIGAGGAHDPPGRRGLAHLFEHLQFSDEFVEQMSLLGADYNAFTTTTQTTYHANIHVDQLEALAWAEAKRFTRPVFSAEEIENERPVVLAEWGLANDTVGDALATDVFATAWPGHDYASPIIGVRTEFDAITPQDLERFWARYYVPSNTRWIVVGGVRAKEVVALAEKYFGWIPPGRPADPIPPPTVVHPLRETGTPTVLASEGDRHSLAFVCTYDPKDEVPITLAVTALSDDRSGLPARLRGAFGDGATFDLMFEGLPGSSTISFHAEIEPWPGVAAVRGLMDEEIARVFDRRLAPETDRRTRAILEVESLAYDHPALLAELIADERAVSPRIDYRTAAEILAEFSPDRVHAATRRAGARGVWIHFSPSTTVRAPVPPTAARSVVALPVNRHAPRTPPRWPSHLPRMFPLDPHPPRIEPLASRQFSIPLGPESAGPFLDVLLRPEPASDRVVMWARVARGASSDPLDAIGLAMITAEASLPDPEFAAVEVYPWAEDIIFTVLVAKRDLERGVALLARWLRDPRLEADRIELETERRELASDPDFLDFESIGLARLFEEVLGDPRFSPPLEHRFDANAITQARANEWWEASVAPSQTTLIIGGAFDEPKLRALLAEYFEGWTREGAEDFGVAPRPPEVERKIILLPRVGEHLQVAVGFPAPAAAHPERLLFEEWSTYLSSSTEVLMREERGFSYGPSAGYAPFARAGVVWASFDLPESALLEALEALDDVLDEQLSPELYEGRQPDRAMQEAFLAQGRSSLDQRLNLLLRGVRHPTLPPVEEFIRREVPAADLARAARSIIDRDRMVWVITGAISEATESSLREAYPRVEIEKE